MKSILYLTLFLALLVSSARGEKKKKEINFEGAVVEGVGRQSLDSLSQVAGGENKDEIHLYEKRDDYSDRDEERVDELIETY